MAAPQPSIDDLLAQRAQTINLNAGPSPLPLPALITASSALLSLPATPGMGVAEISHRSKAFEGIIQQAEKDVRALLQVPEQGYKVLWMQGGGLTLFASSVLNLLAAYRLKHKLKPEDEVVGEYVITGSWSLKASQEGARMGITTRVVADGRKASEDGKKFRGIPDVATWDLAAHQGKSERKPAFIYYCDNETVDGVEFAADSASPASFPFSKIDPDVPIICDVSSNYFSRPVEVAKHGVVFGGAQKNLGPAGIALVVVRDDLLVDPDLSVPFGGPRMPIMLSFKAMADSGSLYNTPPTFPIYLSGLVLSSLLSSPPSVPTASSSSSTAPLAPLDAFASYKSSLIYSAIDGSGGFYKGTADKAARSRMNVTLRIAAGAEVEKKFVKEAEGRGIHGCAGHRSVGGIRASIYNAVTIEQVEAFVAFMKEFQKANEAA